MWRLDQWWWRWLLHGGSGAVGRRNDGERGEETRKEGNESVRPFNDQLQTFQEELLYWMWRIEENEWRGSGSVEGLARRIESEGERLSKAFGQLASMWT